MTTARAALALAAASVYSSLVLAAPPIGLGQSCVLGANEVNDCSYSSSSPSVLRDTVSVAARPAACGDGDDSCFCLKSIEITNSIRAEGGKGPLKAGPQAMLKNAMGHSRAMSAGLGMVHQDLKTAGKEVGCDVFVNRENVAWYEGYDVDPAEQLMKQWKESPPHYKNIMGAEDGDYVIIGIFTAADGKTWGTQTFGQGDSKCPMVGAGSDAPAAVTEAPSNSATVADSSATTAGQEGNDYYRKQPKSEKKPTEKKPSEETPSKGVIDCIYREKPGSATKTRAPGLAGKQPKSEDKPSEDKPSEDKPSKEKPSKETPSKETPNQGPCSDGDVKCACIEAVAVTNRIRAEKGKGPLVAGPMKMLENAVKHSKWMDANGMEHQDLGTTADKVGCDIFIKGENVAQNNVGYDEAAEVTMEQWKNSPGHYQNIMNQEDGGYVVVGFYKAPSGKLWGTQTFGSGDSSCPLIVGGTKGADLATDAPAKTTAKPDETYTKAAVDSTAAGNGDGGEKPGSATATKAPVLTKAESDAPADLSKRDYKGSAETTIAATTTAIEKKKEEIVEKVADVLEKEGATEAAGKGKAPAQKKRDVASISQCLSTCNCF